MVKYDPHNHEKYYMNWKTQGSPIIGVTDANRQIILEFLGDMEIGANINPKSKKGFYENIIVTQLRTLCTKTVLKFIL